MLEYLKRKWIRLPSWQAKKWKDFNELINSREVQENIKRIDTDEEGSNWGMGEVPEWCKLYPHLQSDELRASGKMGQSEKKGKAKTET